MSESVRTNTHLVEVMLSVIVAQFLSASDNALLFATLALLKAQFYLTGFSACFAMVFVALTFFLRRLVGQIATAAKGRVMMVATVLNWRER